MAFYGKLTHDCEDSGRHRLDGEYNVTAEGVPNLRKRLAARIRARRDELGLSQQALADRAGVGVNTIIRMEQADFAERRTKTWAPVEEALDWPTRFFDRYLAGEVSDDLESRYQRREPVTDTGHLIGVVEDAIYQLYITGAPGAPFEEYDKTRQRVLKALRDAGIDTAKRHDGTSSGTDEDS